MEITIAWWWIIKGIIFIITMFSVYKFVKTKSKFWAIGVMIMVTLTIINPLKIEQPTTINQQYQSDIVKLVKPKIVDNSFKQSTNINGITKKDLK